jgi:hypothetical protein
MRALIVTEPGPIGPPPEAIVGILEAFRDWRDRWRPKMEAFEFFAGRPGGWGVFNGEETELSQAMMEFPLAQFASIQVHPTVEGDEALARLTATMKQMLEAMGT